MSGVYEPKRLISDVIRLLAAAGLSPVLSTGNTEPALRAAGQLLAALEVVPDAGRVEVSIRACEVLAGDLIGAPAGWQPVRRVDHGTATGTVRVHTDPTDPAGGWSYLPSAVVRVRREVTS